MTLICPVCGTRCSLEKKCSDIALYRCPDCDHCFSNVKSLNSVEEYNSDYYEVEHRNWFENPNLGLFNNISEFISKNKNDGTMLEIGCGKGDFLKFIKKNNPDMSLTGIDLSLNESVAGIEFIQGNVLTTNFNKKYDYVVSLAVIEHVEDIQAFIKIMKKLCSDNGWIIIMTLNDRSILYETARFFYRFGYTAPFERLYSKHHLNHFNVRSIRRLIQCNGLSLIKIILHNIPLAAVDFPPTFFLKNIILRTGVLVTFLLGYLFKRTYLQTVICQKS